MSPFDQLGLPPDADERMVKRAYAQRLRTTRPDSDPEGFQRLHAIYQSALAQCRGRIRHGAAVAATMPLAEPVATVDASPPAAPAPATIAAAPSSPLPSRSSSTAAATPVAAPTPFAFERFWDELAAKAFAGNDADLRGWLDEQPALWSLRLKARVGHELFTRLYRKAPPMPPACLDTLLAFFDMHHARSGHDPLQLMQLQRRMQLAWELDPAQRDALAGRLAMRDRDRRRLLDRRLQRLSRPFHWIRAIPTALRPNASTQLAQFILQLSLGHPKDLPPSLDAAQLRFWLDAVDGRRVSRARLVLGGIRCLATLLGSLVLGVLFGRMFRLPPERFAFGALEFTVGAALFLCLVWAAWMALLPLDGWHAKPEEQPARWPWLNLLLIPALCAVGLAVWLPAGHNPLAMVPLVAAVWLALRRLARRNATKTGINPRMTWVALYLGIAVLSGLTGNHDPGDGIAAYAYLLAVAAMVMWGIDLWRHRRILRVRRPAT